LWISKIPADDEGKARGRLQALREAGVQTGIWWYADHPTHYAGNAAHGMAEAGEHILDAIAQSIAGAVPPLFVVDNSVPHA
jgi:creatinine amidohydrolase